MEVGETKILPQQPSQHQGTNSIGATKRGIGPCYSAKAIRPSMWKARLVQRVWGKSEHPPELNRHGGNLEAGEGRKELQKIGFQEQKLKNMCCFTDILSPGSFDISSRLHFCQIIMTICEVLSAFSYQRNLGQMLNPPGFSTHQETASALVISCTLTFLRSKTAATGMVARLFQVKFLSKDMV